MSIETSTQGYSLDEEVRRYMDSASSDFDLSKAYSIASESAMPDAMYIAALFKYLGVSVGTDRDSAKSLLAKAAEAGHVPASIVLEEIDRNPVDVEDALVALRFKAEQRDLEACREIFPIYDTGKSDGKKGPAKKDHVESVRLYMPCADAGDAEALNTIGYMYLMGKGVDKDRDLALDLLTRAYEDGCAQAAHRIAYMYDMGQCFTDPDIDKAVEWYKKAAEMEYPDSEFALAGIMMVKEYKYYNAAKAVKYLVKAADAKNPDAMHQAGLMYAYGSHGIKRDPERAKKYLEGACEAGLDQAMVDYANMCFEGQVLDRDLSISAKWFLKATEHFNGVAQYALGCMYGNGFYFDRDDKEAARWFQEAAEGGEPNAQYALACFYYEGRGIERDEKKAFTWFQEAADQGHMGAMSFMAMFMISGKNTEQDVEGGVDLLKKAADNGYYEAQFYLGKLYAEGEYVEKDIPYAKKMLTLAAKQGDMDAKEMLDMLKKKRR